MDVSFINVCFVFVSILLLEIAYAIHVLLSAQFCCGLMYLSQVLVFHCMHILP